MGAEDQRDFVTFHGIKYVDWNVTFGKFINHKQALKMNYIHIDCACTEYTQATAAATGYSIDVEFLFPHHIKKKYYIEGVIEGEFTVACNGGASEITDYRISVWKTNDDTTYEQLGVTSLGGSEWISVCDTLSWDAGNSIGQERRYHWSIDCWTAQELKEKDRIFLKIEIRGTNDKLYLMHANDPDWEDVWIKIPFRL
jgi:hypothetical protein